MPSILQVGDHVRMRMPVDARQTGNRTFEIMTMPVQGNNKPTWWELKGDQDGLIYVFTMLVVFDIVPV